MRHENQRLQQGLDSTSESQLCIKMKNSDSEQKYLCEAFKPFNKHLVTQLVVKTVH